MLRSIVTFFIITAYSLQGNAATDSVAFAHFDISNGLPGNNVYSLVKDKKGYMWFATDKGVARYNGYSFTHYNMGTGLPSNDVWQLYVDKQDRVWVYSFGYQFGYIKDGRYKALPMGARQRVITASWLSEGANVVWFLTSEDDAPRLFLCFGDMIKSIPLYSKTDSIFNKALSDVYLCNDFFIYIKDTNDNVYNWDLVNGGRLAGRFTAPKSLAYGYRYRRSISPHQDKILPETGTIVTITLKNIKYVA